MDGVSIKHPGEMRGLAESCAACGRKATVGKGIWPRLDLFPGCGAGSWRHERFTGWRLGCGRFGMSAAFLLCRGK